MEKKQMLKLGGLVLLAVFAIAGWARDWHLLPTAEPHIALAPTPVVAVPAAKAASANLSRGVVASQPASTTAVVRRGRSTKTSVALVAGSAGVGAAVGALAGGGKGAAIGALSGAGAGFVYDRLTHKTHTGL